METRSRPNVAATFCSNCAKTSPHFRDLDSVAYATKDCSRSNRIEFSSKIAPRLRERITHAFEASGLSREAYAELMQSRDESINAHLDAALEGAAERTAKDEALLRAFEGSGKTMEEFAEMYGLDPRASARVLERARKRVPSA